MSAAQTPALSGLASRVRVYEVAALGDAPAFPHLAGCCITGAQVADMAIERRRDGDELLRVLRAAEVSL